MPTQNVHMAARNVEWDFLCNLQTLWIMQKLTLANITKWDYFGIFKLFTFYLRGTDAIMFLLYIFAIINLLRKMPIFAREWRETRKSCFCSNICRRVVFLWSYSTKSWNNASKLSLPIYFLTQNKPKEKFPHVRKLDFFDFLQPDSYKLIFSVVL